MSDPDPFGNAAPAPCPICPHLGTEDDPQTCLEYPSHWNFCHGARPPAAVRLSHQESACLSAGHAQCPVFQSEQRSPLPFELRAQRGR